MAVFIFFRLPSLFLLSIAKAMQKKNALVNKKILNPAYKSDFNHYKVYSKPIALFVLEIPLRI